jgi:hypothetical protein
MYIVGRQIVEDVLKGGEVGKLYHLLEGGQVAELYHLPGGGQADEAVTST